MEIKNVEDLNWAEDKNALNHTSVNELETEELDFPVDKNEDPAPLLTDIMIDLETLSTGPRSCVISIAAIMFDIRSGKTGPAFIRNIDIASNVRNGRVIDPDTLTWWIDENGKQFARWCEVDDKVGLPIALADLIDFIKENTIGLRSFQVWGNSNRFDLGILDNCFTSFGMENPWSFRGERDVRTLASLNPAIKKEAKDEWAAKGYNLHDPLVDCRLQISYCSAIYNIVKPEVEPVNDLDFTVEALNDIEGDLTLTNSKGEENAK